MGSCIDLTVGGLPIDWGKNAGFRNHGTLFHEDDVCQSPYDYVDDDGADITELSEAACRPLALVADRLELLGFTSQRATREISSVYDDGYTSTSIPYSPLQISAALQSLDLAALPNRDDTYTTQFHSRLASAVYTELVDSHRSADERATKWGIADVLDDVDPYALLRLLADNPSNLDISVCWRFADVVKGGWVDRSMIVDSLGCSRPFLVVTEGKSDSSIIERSLRWLKPNVADFFRFVDMKEDYPFTGTGNLYRFCQGLQKIGIENQIIVVYDNDVAGVAQCNRTLCLELPSNFAVMRLPDNPLFRAFNTIGPSGEGQADINGRAASIECYLDLAWGAEAKPMVRWGGYDSVAEAYQGKLIGKQQYAKRFLKLGHRPHDYDMSKLEKVVDELITIAVSVAECQLGE